MSRTVRQLPRRPRSVLLTGTTGFVGQAVLERFLRQEAFVHVLIRPRTGRTGTERLNELLAKEAFDGWRQEVGAAGVARARARLRVIEADLAHGLPALPADLDLVVHSASTVSFDAPWDHSMRANVLGPQHLYEALHAAGARPHVIHVSTAYVGTDRVALSTEEPVEHDVDWRGEVAASLARRAMLDSEAGMLPVPATSGDTRMRELGRLRANQLGWTDVYTMSKALGERVAEELWAGRGLPLTVLRPTIIESAVARPHPGWIDGFKVADPLIAAYAKDRLVAFPGRPEEVIDIVPVDVVVDAVMAADAVPHEDTAAHTPAGHARYFQVGTGVSNPITLDRFRAHVEDYLRAHPWTSRDGTPIRPRPWRFLPPGDIDSWASRRSTVLTRTADLLDLIPGLSKPTRRRIEPAIRRLTLLRNYVSIYQPYTCSRTTYDDTQTRRLLTRAAELGVEGALDVRRIDWHDYIRNVHMPSLTRVAERRRRKLTPVVVGDTVRVPARAAARARKTPIAVNA